LRDCGSSAAASSVEAPPCGCSAKAAFSMLRRALGLTTAGGTAACAYAYYEAKQRMGADAVARIVSYDIVAVPAIVEYKWLEAKCEKLPKVLPSLFPPVSDEEERAQFQVLHRKWAKPLFDKLM
jgi:hypothetical protein